MLKKLNFIACVGLSILALVPLQSAWADNVYPIQKDNVYPIQKDDVYFKQGREILRSKLKIKPNTNRAKNVILIIGDGMGFSTVTAARIFEGQQRNIDGESNILAWESFPYLAASKTYSANAQITESAQSATAMTTGVKTINDVLGLNYTARLNNCYDQKTKQVSTLWELAESFGMSTGVVTTTRVTHATPAATYAHSGYRKWESDSDMPEDALGAGCTDIARQLIEMPYGDGLDVILGGGRSNFMPSTMPDSEDSDKMGKRKDGKNLIEAWLDRYSDKTAKKKTKAFYVSNKQQFDRINPKKTDHLLGLFASSHMKFEYDRAQDKNEIREPSLVEMSEKAIDILSRNRKGYVLMIEAGRIDHAAHAGNAYRMLSDTVALNEAVKAVLRKVNLKETLIIVTGDHSHTLTISGYAKRGNPILGIAVGVDDTSLLDNEGKPYTTLSFANGPGGGEVQKLQQRPTVTMAEAIAPDFIQHALVPLPSETHGGEDLGIYAIGPWSHLFQGTVEEHYIFHVMKHAVGI